MKKSLIIICCTILLFSCKKESDTSGENNPPAPPPVIGGVTTDYGDILQLGIDSVKMLNGTTGLRSKSFATLFNGFGISRNQSTVEDSILYYCNQYNFAAVSLKTGTVIYTKTFSGTYFSGVKAMCYPLIVGDIIYITNHDINNEQSFLYAYNKKTGVPVFNANISYGSGSFEPTFATPLVSGNNIFVGACQDVFFAPDKRASIYCFNRLTGALKWNKIVNNSSPNINPFLLLNAAGQIIISTSKSFGAYESNIYGLDTTTGQIMWQNQFGVSEESVEKVLKNSKIYTITEYGSKLVTINASNGQLINTLSIAPSQNTKYKLAADALYFVDDNNKLKCIALDNYALIFDINLSAQNITHALSKPVVTDKHVYVPVNVSPNIYTMFVFDKNTGVLAKQVPMPLFNPSIAYNVLKSNVHFVPQRGLQ